jgi:hypothetical protein
MKKVSCVVGFGEEVWPDVRKHPVRPLSVTLTDAQCTRFPPGEYLGSGFFASAYAKAGSKTKVVKFTGDAVEAKNARKLMGKRLKGTVRVFDVAQLRGVTGNLPVKPLESLATTAGQPLFALTTELVKEVPHSGSIVGAIQSVWDQYSELRDNPSERKKLKPSTFRARDYVDTVRAIDECAGVHRGNPKECQVVVKQLLDAIDEQAAHGVIPLDLHFKNWGLRGKQPVILDLGVSVDDKKPVKIDLAKAPRGGRMARRRRVR